MDGEFIESTDKKAFEIRNHVRPKPVHQINVFLGQLKRCALKAPAPWRGLENEPKVNVYYMTICYNKDVSVVSIFDVEDVVKETISGKALHEVLLSLFKQVIPKVQLVVAPQVPLLRELSLQSVKGYGVWYELNEPRRVGGCDDIVREQE
jgi:hypothetical protein